MNIKPFTRCIIISIAVFLYTSHVCAIPLFYTNESSYATAASNAGIILSTESFETSTNPNFPGGSISVSGGGGIASIFAGYTTDGNSAVEWWDTATITFNTPINAFAIDIIDLGTYGATTLTLTTDTGSQVLFNNFTGGDYNVLFAGVIDTENQFASATLSNTSTLDWALLDRMQTGITTVPEPSILALLSLGIFGISVVRRKNV